MGSLLFRKLNCFTDFHHTQIGFDVALFQFAIEHFRCARQHGKSSVVHGNYRSRINQLHRFGRTRWSHRKMVTDTNQHDVDLVETGHQCHVGKQICVARVINRRATANRNHQSGAIAHATRAQT